MVSICIIVWQSGRLFGLELAANLWFKFGHFVLCVTRVYEQYRRVLHQERVLAVTGVVERQGAVVNVMAERFATLRVICTHISELDSRHHFPAKPGDSDF